MRNIDKLFLIEGLHRLIKLEFRGSSKDYADRLKISRSSFHNYIDDLKTVGAEIEYSKARNCYKYINDFEFEIKIKKSHLSLEEMGKISGGNIFSTPVQYFGLGLINFVVGKKNSFLD